MKFNIFVISYEQAYICKDQTVKCYGKILTQELHLFKMKANLAE